VALAAEKITPLVSAALGKIDGFYQIREDGWVLFKIPRCLLVFTHEELLKAIKRGKCWRRHGGEKLTANNSRN